MKRLGLNKGRYHGEGLDVAVYLREFHDAALSRGWATEQFADISGFQLFGYRRGPADATRTVYISTGMHGDEPAGPVALRRFVEEDRWRADTRYILCPCVNPTGLQLVTRENWNGIDLNREYRHPLAPEVVAHIAWLKKLPDLDLALTLHEDWEADGYYVYEVNPANLPPLAPTIIQSVREVCPIQPSSKIDEMWDCHDGIIHPHIKPEDRPKWAEALYLVLTKTNHSLTLEAPSDFPLTFRVEAHVRALRAALAIS